MLSAAFQGQRGGVEDPVARRHRGRQTRKMVDFKVSLIVLKFISTFYQLCVLDQVT